jgi:hypothetical protein
LDSENSRLRLAGFLARKLQLPSRASGGGGDGTAAVAVAPLRGLFVSHDAPLFRMVHEMVSFKDRSRPFLAMFRDKHTYSPLKGRRTVNKTF